VIRAVWFELLPKRTWQTWFWARVSKELRVQGIRGTDLVRVQEVAEIIDSQVIKTVSKLSS